MVTMDVRCLDSEGRTVKRSPFSKSGERKNLADLMLSAAYPLT
jgi:hypothetical protein